MIRVMLVDDEALIRGGLRAIVDAEEDLVTVAEAADGAEVTPAVRRAAPDVVLMDVRMPGVDGIEATRRLLARIPEPPRVIVLTTFEHDDYVLEALRAGAAGFLLKRASADELVGAIRIVAAGDSVLFPAAVRRLAAAAARPAPGLEVALSAREADVLRLVARGLSNAEIAGELILGTETIKSHVAALLAKLGVRDRTQAVARAYESGFITPGEERGSGP